MDLTKQIKQEKIIVTLLTGIQFFNILDFVVLLPLAPSLMRNFGITPSQFSLLASSYSLSAGAVGIFYSTIADIFDRKKFLMWMIVGFILSTLVCAVAPTFETLLIARTMAGVFGGVITPVIYAIIADIIPFERRGKAMGTIMASFSFTSIIGIPIGLAIADFWSWRLTFHFIGAGMSLIFLINFFILPLVPVSGASGNIKEKLHRVYKIAIDKNFRTPYLTMFLFTSSGFLLFPFLSPYGVNNIGILETDLKYLYFVGGLFTVVSSRFAGKLTDTYGSFRVFVPAVLCSLPFIYLYTTAENLSLLIVLIISTGFMVFINFRFVPIMTLISKSPDESNRGSFMGVLLSIRSLASALATAFTGFIVYQTPDGKLVNFNHAGEISIALTIIGSICFYFLHLHDQRKGDERAPQCS